MPEVISTDPEFFGEGKIFLTGSKTSPGKVYITLYSTEGKWNCTCPGWTYRYKCRHVTEVGELLNIDDEGSDDFQVSL